MPLENYLDCYTSFQVLANFLTRVFLICMKNWKYVQIFVLTQTVVHQAGSPSTIVSTSCWKLEDAGVPSLRIEQNSEETSSRRYKRVSPEGIGIPLSLSIFGTNRIASPFSKYSWPLKNIGLNSPGPLKCKLFPTVNITTWQSPHWLNPWMLNHRYGGPPICYMRIFDHNSWVVKSLVMLSHVSVMLSHFSPVWLFVIS